METQIGKQIIQLRHEGKSYKEIESILHCGKGLISYHCSKNGMGNIGLREDVSSDTVEQWREYALSHTMNETAQAFEISVTKLRWHGIRGNRKAEKFTVIKNDELQYLKHDSSDKGDLGVAMVTANIMQLGYSVFMPVSATCPFDLLVYYDNDFKRVQVKYSRCVDGAITAFAYRSSIANNKITARLNVDFDILAVYCPDTNACYYINRDEFHGSIKLRVTAVKNNQTLHIRYADDYLPNGPVSALAHNQ